MSVHRARLLFGVVVLISLIILFAPGRAVPPSPHDSDKLVHAGLFGALTVSGWWATRRHGALVGALAAYAVLSEVIQAVAPIGRDGGVPDALTDLVGIVLGLLADVAVRRIVTRRTGRGRPPQR